MLVAVAVFSFAPRASAETDLVNGVQAVVHDSVVTFAELQERMVSAKEVLCPAVLRAAGVARAEGDAAMNENLEQLIERRLILQDFRNMFSQKEQIAFANKEIAKDVDKELEGRFARLRRDRMAFVRTLQARGSTLERHRQQIRDRII